MAREQEQPSIVVTQVATDDSALPQGQVDARARQGASGRAHVESEQLLRSVLSLAEAPFELYGFVPSGSGTTRVLSADPATGESTERVALRQGWCAPIGHFTTDIELFVLSGELCQGGFVLREHCYSYIPAGMPTGPWQARADTVLLWMPDAKATYVTADYSELDQELQSAVYHRNAQAHPRIGEYAPKKELAAMKWESTTFLPPGSARKSLLTHAQSGRATWVLGLVPMWPAAGAREAHPTTEEAYCLAGDIYGHWSMSDDPFAPRYAVMEKDGYMFRPAHLPHGPFGSKTGALALFRTKARLDVHWTLPN